MDRGRLATSCHCGATAAGLVASPAVTGKSIQLSRIIELLLYMIGLSAISQEVLSTYVTVLLDYYIM